MSLFTKIKSYFSPEGKGVLKPSPIPPPPILREVTLPSGRVSVPNDTSSIYRFLKSKIPQEFVKPSYRPELIGLIRDLYKVNPDVSIAVQDMYKLSNTNHSITFPNNSEKEAKAMRDHLEVVSKRWSNYTSGIFGITNKLFVQLLVSGAISIEAVPLSNLSGLSHITFVNPDDIIFKRDKEGVYHPYQKNRTWNKYYNNKKPRDLIKLNINTYKYVAGFNDTDEPYGIPPFLAALDSLKTQADMKVNQKNIMEILGHYGFVNVTIAKPDQRANESDPQYVSRLNNMLDQLKDRTKNSLADGIFAGYSEDHEIELQSTTKDLANIDKPWAMNQQSVANGLGISGSIIGVDSGSKTEGGTSIMFSKLLSQLTNAQGHVKYVLEFIYDLELRLAGFGYNKGSRVKFFPSTATDEVKIQQGREYKIRNLDTLYKMGIISLEDFAYEAGYSKPDQKEPRVSLEKISDTETSKKESDREKDKDKSDRTSRDKSKSQPKRKDGETKER